MAASASGPSARVPQPGPFLIQIVGLGSDFTWKDLKDLIRPVVTHSTWVENNQVTFQGSLHPRHSIKVRTAGEAKAAYDLICQSNIAGRTLYVELWNISDNQPISIMYRNFNPAQINISTHSQVERLADPNKPWMHAWPGGQQPNQMTAMPSYATPATMMSPQPYQAQSVQPNTSGAQMSQMQYEQLREQQQAYQVHVQQAAAYQQMAYGQQFGSSTNTDGLPVNASSGVARTENREVFVQNLSYKAKEGGLAAHFRKAGELEVVNVKITTNSKGESRGSAAIEFASSAQAALAIRRFHGTEFMGRDIQLRPGKVSTVVEAPPPQRTMSGPSGPLIVDGSGARASR